jgi:aspartyl-tRNA(Asn)/glutamyl-tRNA(Gln) amidotransferase subunit C
MAQDAMDVHYVAELARLRLTPDEEREFGRQLGQVLEFMAQLREVDVSGVEPMAHAAPRHNVMRRDEARPGLSQADALRNAPLRTEGLFIVPRIVE